MFRPLLTLSIILIIIACSNNSTNPKDDDDDDNPPDTTNTWQLVWSDEFDYTGIPDSRCLRRVFHNSSTMVQNKRSTF